MKKFIQKHHKLLVQLLKWTIFLLSVLFLYRELFLKRNFPELMAQYGARCAGQWRMILVVILLNPVNWGLEAHKWKRLMQPDCHLGKWRAFAATLSGITVSVLTPNRVGEFAGRMLYVEPQHRDKAVAMSLAGSFGQLLATFLGGVVCGVWFFYLKDGTGLLLPALIGLASIAGLIYVYFRLAYSNRLFERWDKLVIISRIRETLKGLDRKKLLEALLWSCLRYSVYCIQLGLLLFALVEFDPELTVKRLIYTVPLYFFFQTIVPTIALSEIGVRGMLLSTVFLDTAPESDLVLTSTLLWLINIAIPAVAGGVFLLGLRFRLNGKQ